MSAHPPPVPPEQQNKFGSSGSGAPSDAQPENFKAQNRNLAEQGRQGNTKQNTTNKGLQQDR